MNTPFDLFGFCLPAYQESTRKRVNAWLTRPTLYRREEAIIASLAGDTTDSILLDLGCGPGRYAHCLAYREYYGVEPRDESVEYAKQWARAENLTKCFFVHGSLFDDWPVKPDLVLTTSVFRHFKDPLGGYQHVWETLPPGSSWITSFLTQAHSPQLEVSGQFACRLPEHAMYQFLVGKPHTRPNKWFEEAGDWWLVKLTKEKPHAIEG